MITKSRVMLAAVLLAGAALTISPAAASAASSLTTAQIAAVEGLLQSFGASASVIANVDMALRGAPWTPPPTASSTPPAPGTGLGGLIPKCIVLYHTLSPGATDSTTDGDVTTLQQALGVSATGYYGAQTAAAVQAFQAQQGISQVGIVGPATRAILSDWCNTHGLPIPPVTPPGGGLIPPPHAPPVATSTSATLSLGQTQTFLNNGMRITLALNSIQATTASVTLTGGPNCVATTLCPQYLLASQTATLALNQSTAYGGSTFTLTAISTATATFSISSLTRVTIATSTAY